MYDNSLLQQSLPHSDGLIARVNKSPVLDEPVHHFRSHHASTVRAQMVLPVADHVWGSDQEDSSQYMSRSGELLGWNLETKVFSFLSINGRKRHFRPL